MQVHGTCAETAAVSRDLTLVDIQNTRYKRAKVTPLESRTTRAQSARERSKQRYIKGPTTTYLLAFLNVQRDVADCLWKLNYIAHKELVLFRE